MGHTENMDAGFSPEQQLPRTEGESHEDYLDRLYRTMADELISGKLPKEDFIKLQKADRLKRDYEATHDGLTGLLNYKGFTEAYENTIEVMRSGGSVDGVLAFIDVDGLKRFNDRQGHQAGNKLLKIYADVINNHIEGLREIEQDKDIASLVGRYGGDEFIFFLRGVNLEQVKKMVDSIVERIPRAIQEGFNNPNFNQTVSIGLAVLRNDDQVDSSIEKVDKAMYQAKQTGNTVVVSPI